MRGIGERRRMVAKCKNLHRRWSVDKETVKKGSRRQRLQRPRESKRSSIPQAYAGR